MCPESCVVGLSTCRQFTETLLEDHREHSKTEDADPRADSSCTIAGGENSSFRPKTRCSALTWVHRSTHWASRVSAPHGPTSWVFFWDMKGLEIQDISDRYSDNKSQQGLFCFTGGCRAAHQEENVAVMRKTCMSWGSTMFTWAEVEFHTLTHNLCMWEEKFC